MLKPQAPKLPPLIRRPAVLRLLIIALLAEISYAVLNISTMPVYLSEKRGFGEFLVSIVFVSFLLSEAIFKGPMGHLADRYGCRLFMIVGPAITLCTSILTIVLPGGNKIGFWEPVALIVMRILDGVGAAMLWPAAFAEMGAAVEDKDRQQAMSLLNMCYLLGIALAMPIGGIAEDLAGSAGKPQLSAGLYLAAVFFGCITLAALFLIPKEPVHDQAALSEPEGFHVRQLIEAFKAIPVFVLLAVITFMGVGFPMVIIKKFALEEFRLSPTQFGALVFPAAISMALLSGPVSRWGAKLGKYTAVHLGMGLCAAGLCFISLGAFFPILHAAWALALGGIPLGVGFLMTIPAWMTSVTDLDPRRKATNLGAIMTAQGIGAMIGATLGGLMYEKMVPVGEKIGFGQTFGHYSPFFGCAFCVTLGWLLSLRYLCPERIEPRAAGAEGPV